MPEELDGESEFVVASCGYLYEPRPREHASAATSRDTRYLPIVSTVMDRPERIRGPF